MDAVVEQDSFNLEQESLNEALSCVSTRVKYTCMDCSNTHMMFGANSGSVYVYDLSSLRVAQMCSFPEIREAVQKVLFVAKTSEFSLSTSSSTTKDIQLFNHLNSLAIICCQRASFIVDLALTIIDSSSGKKVASNDNTVQTGKPKVIAKLDQTKDASITNVVTGTALDDKTIPAIYFGDSKGNIFQTVKKTKKRLISTYIFIINFIII